MDINSERLFCHRGFYGVTDIGHQRDPDAKGDALVNYPPENSKESVEAAFKNGFSVEIDVTMTKDACLIVTHTDDLSFHSAEARQAGGGSASQTTFEQLQKMKTGLGGKTAPFLTYCEFKGLLSQYPDVLANIEIKGTIQDKLTKEPQNPSLIDRLIEETPMEIQGRIIWSSFANSNIIKMKTRIPDANVAQLFAEPARLATIGREDPVYPDTDDTYMQFCVGNLQRLDPRIKSVHPSIDSLMSKEGAAAVAYCAAKNIAIRSWALSERDPEKNAAAKEHLLNALQFRTQFPDLHISFITDYALAVQKIIHENDSA